MASRPGGQQASKALNAAFSGAWGLGLGWMVLGGRGLATAEVQRHVCNRNRATTGLALNAFALRRQCVCRRLGDFNDIVVTGIGIGRDEAVLTL
jgi:hypothetical protein